MRRSPLREPAEVVAVARAAAAAGLSVVGLMFYDAQIAGLPDSSPAVRLVKKRSAESLARRRGEVVAAVREVADLEFVNGGGTGSLHVTGQDPAVTELAAGSGLYGPDPVRRLRRLHPAPAAAFALPVVRRPGAGVRHGVRRRLRRLGAAGVVAGARAVRPRAASSWCSPKGWVRCRLPLQGNGVRGLALGDKVWFRYAKAGEMCERFDAAAPGQRRPAGRDRADLSG